MTTLVNICLPSAASFGFTWIHIKFNPGLSFEEDIVLGMGFYVKGSLVFGIFLYSCKSVPV